MEAKDILIRVDWGGAFNGSRGTYTEDAKKIEGVKYFRRAASNGGGSGYDYWVVPVGFYRSRSLEEDGRQGKAKTGRAAEMESRVAAYREKHALLRQKTSKENDEAYRAKLEAEERSRQNRDALLPRIQELGKKAEELDKSQRFCKCKSSVPKPENLGDTYFQFGSKRYLYTEGNITKSEDDYLFYNSAIARPDRCPCIRPGVVDRCFLPRNGDAALKTGFRSFCLSMFQFHQLPPSFL